MPATDAKSLYDAVRRLSTSFAEKRVQIDVAAIRTSSSHTIRLVPTNEQVADGLIKRNPAFLNELRLWCENPVVKLMADGENAVSGRKQEAALRKEAQAEASTCTNDAGD